MRNPVNPIPSHEEQAQEAANRVTIIDRDNEARYRVRVEGQNEGSNLYVTNSGASTDYLNMLAERLETALNGTDWKLAAGQEGIFRFHREGDTPPAIMVPSLTSRSVTVSMKDPYSNNNMPSKLTIRQGETVVSKPADEALMISMALERFDGEVDGVITELTLNQEIMAIAEQLDEVTTMSILKALSDNAGSAKYMVKDKVAITPSMTAAQRVEAIEDAIDKALVRGRQFGNHIGDFVIGLNAQSYRDVDRIARRSGTGAVSDFLGTAVYTYAGDPTNANDLLIVVAPKRHIAVSFREAADGKVFDFIVSRQPATQSTTLEMVACADMLVAGFVKAQKEDGAAIEVNLPLIQAFTAES
ncbi:hypothetical protein [Aeromonas hydrophila]|uniref:hypothetical protein n=1 Tax=Aeromonas hydrophila TaxID=644 RepID=UPI002B47CAEB|nr:hypothetical protein [Aeromonas hydrophila]